MHSDLITYLLLWQRFWKFPDIEISSVNKIPHPPSRTTPNYGAGSVFSPRHSFLRKYFDVFIWETGLARLPKISVTGMKIFPYEHSSPGNRDETF